MRIRALLILALAAGIHAGPIGFEDSTCSTTCVPTVKFGYEAGRTYRFEYETETVTSMAGASEESSGLHIKTTADVTVQSACELVLTLRDATLEELHPSDVTSRQVSPNNAEFKAAVEKSALRFSFQDGRVEELCASEDDPIWVVNFKRGILSAFQNSMDNFKDDAVVPETDVSGECEADYAISQSGLDSIVITKSKNLMACTKRTNYFTSMQATAYSVPSSIQSLPILKSTHECKQTISTLGVLQRSECQETHVFRPFSNGDSGARTTVTQTLEYQSEVRTRVMPDPVTTRVSLIFEHESRATGKSSNKNHVRTTLEEICASTDIRPQTPAMFSKLVYTMRQMDVNSLNALHRMVEAGRICQQNSAMAKKFFHDAVPAVGTPASVALISQLTENGEVTGVEASVWLTSLAFIQEPNADMIRQAKALILTAQNTDAFLPVSSLIHTFCKSTECENNEDVKEVLSHLTQNLGYNCKVAIAQRDLVILSLKAIGNVGNSANVAGTLVRCAGNTDLDQETRVSALQAFHRLPCDEETTENMLKILRDIDEDSELRIAAYLGVMKKCPSATLLDQIKTILATEEVNQVGSFIWTHLTNLMETSDPLKQEIRAIIEDEILSKEFNMDQRKFSRNYEGSIFWESLNAGASYESNLIWSPSSFLPRSAMLNLTVDMFGKSVNLLEVGGRMEGVEQYLEKFFGPHGYFPEGAISDVIKQKLNQVENKIRPGMLHTPQASAYMKMFGDELKYMNLMGLDINKDDFNILDILIKLAQNHEVDITKSMNFLDTEMTVATVAGLPLKLAVNGTAIIDVKLGGKMDLRRTGTWPTSMDVNGYVKPSAAVTFATTMGVDAFMSRTGLKMVTTLHSSTQMDGLITIEESKIMNVKLNVPKEKVEILNVEAKFYIIHREEEREQKMLTDNMIEKDMCTGDNFGTVTGLKICGGISLPLSKQSDTPYFPFTGPRHAYVTMEMADTHTNYEFEARFETKKEKRGSDMAIVDVARVYFDTPGSRINRRFLAEYTLDKMDKKLSMTLQTPWKEATIDGSMTNTPAVRNANLKVVLDGDQVYAIMAELSTENQGETTIFTPTVSVTLPSMEDMKLMGKLKYISGDKMEVDLSLDNVFREPVTLTGEIDKTNANRYSTSLAFASPILTSEVSGFTVIKDALISSRTQFKYSYNGGRQHQFSLNTKLKDSSSGNTMRYSVNTAVQTSEFPEYNMQLEMDLEQNRKHHESTLEFTYGNNAKDLTKKITWKQVANVEGNRRDLKFDHNLDVKWLAMNVDFASKIAHSHKLYTDLNTQAVITYTPGKSVNLDASLHRVTTSPLEAKGDIQLSYPGREMRLVSSIEETQTNVFTQEMLMQWQTGRKIRAVTTYTIDGLNHQLRTEIYRPSGAMTILSGEGTMKLDDLKGRLDLTHDGQSYSTAVEYKYDLRPRKIEMSGKYDLTIPQRHVVLEGEVSASEKLYSGSLSTMWDADRDASKKVSIDGKVVMNPGNFEGMAKVAYPGKEISLIGNQQMDGMSLTHHSELTWAAGKSISVDLDGSKTATSVQGKIKMSTPFFRDVTINANAEKARQETKGHFDIGYGKTISADISVTPKTGWKNMEGSITLHTPFSVIERLTISGSHDLISPLKTVELEVNRNTNTFAINGNLLLAGDKHEGMVQMNRNRMNAKVTFTNTVTENEIDHHSDVMWNGNTMATIDVKGGMRPAAMWMHSKVITSWTPGFEMNADIKKERQELSSHIDVTCVKSLSSDASMKMVSGWRHIESSVTVHTPFSGYERFVLTGNHDIEGKEKSILWAVARNADTIQLKGNAIIDEARIEGNLELTTPCEKMQSIAIHGTGSYDGTNLISHVEAELMGQKVELDVSGKLEGSKVETNLQVKTPYTEPIALSVSGSADVREPTVHMEVEWQSKKVEIDLGGKNKGGYNTRDIEANFGLKTPYTSDLTVTVAHQVNDNQYTSNGMVQWGVKKASVDFTMTHEMRSGMLKNKGRVAVVTPMQSASAAWDQDIEGFSSIISKNEIEWSGKKMELDLTHKMMFTSDSHQLNTKVSLKTPFQVVRSTGGSVNYEWQRGMLSADATVNYNSKEMASLTASFNGGRKPTGNIAFKSIIPKAEDISIDLKMDNGNGQIEVKWAPGKSITLMHEYVVEASGFNTITTLTTPFRPVEKVTVGATYGVNSRQTETGLTIEYAPSKVISGKVTFGMSSGLVSSLVLTAPCPYFRSLSVSTDNTVIRDQIKHQSDMNFVMDGAEITYTGALTVNGVNDISGRASLTTPYTAVRSEMISIEHHLQQSEYVSKLTYQHNRENVDIETHFMNTPSQFKLSGDCKTSFQMIPSVSMSIMHEGQGSDCNGQVQVDSQIAGKPITLSANYVVGGYNTITGDLVLKTPFDGVQNVGGKFSHIRSGEMFTTTAEVQVNPNSKITLTNEFSMANGVHLATTISTPFRAFKGASINIDHSGDKHAFDTKTKLSTQIRKGSLDVTGNLKWSNGNVDGLVELTTPFGNADRFALTVTNDIQNTNSYKIDSVLVVEYPGTRMQATYNGVSADDNASEVLILTSPFRGFENIKYEGNMKHPTPSEYTYYKAVTYAPQRKIEKEFKVNTADQSGSLRIETPFTKFSHLYVEAGHLGSWSNFNSNLKGEITLNRETFSVDGNVNFKYTPSSLTTNMKVESSFDAFREAGITLSHEAKPNSKYVTALSANLPGYQATLNSILNLASLTDVSGQILLSAPRSVEINFNHHGDHRAFTNHIDCAVDGTTVGTYDGSLTTTLPISAKFEFRSDEFHKLFEVNVDATGQATDMTTNIDMKYAPGTEATIHVGANWKLASGLNAALEVSAPKLIKDVKITIDHDGTYNFNHKTEATYGRKTMTLTGDLSTSPNIEGQMELKTPFRALRTLSANIKFSGSLRKFFTSFNFEHNSANNAGIQVTFDSTNKIGGNINFESSFMNRFTAEINHVTNLPEITTTANIRYKSITINLDMAFKPTEGHFKLQTPWRYVKDVAVTFTHAGPWNNFVNNVEMMYNGNTQFTTATKLKLDRVWEGNIDITTPFTEVRTLSVEFSHKLTGRILRTSGSVKINDETMTASVKCNLNPMEFATAAEIKYKYINIIVDVAFTPTEGHFTLQTPWKYFEDVGVSFTHSGPWNNFENNIVIKYSGNAQFTSATKFQFDRVCAGSIGITTPFAKVRSVSIEFSHKLTDRILQSSGSLTINGELMSVSVNLNLNPLDGVVKFNTPNSENVVTLKHTGDLSAFENSATFDISSFIRGKLEYSGKWNSNPADGTFTLKSDNIETVLAFHHEGGATEFKNSLTLSESGRILLEYKGEMTTVNTVAGLFSIEENETPKVKLQFSHDKRKTSFAFSNKIWKIMDVSGSLQREPSIEAEFQLSTPFKYMKSLEVTVKYEQPMTTFIEVQHNNIGRFRYTGEVTKSATEVIGVFSITSTNKWLKNVQLTVKKDKTNVDVGFSHNMIGTMQCSCSLQTDPHFIGSFELKTPFSLLKSMQLSVKKDDSKVDAEFSHDLLGTMTSSGAIQTEPYTMGTFELKTPFKMMKNVQLTVKSEDSKVDAEFSHNMLGSVQCSYAVLTNPYPMASFELKTPFSILKSLAMQMKAEPIDGGYNIEASFDHNAMGAMLMSTRLQKRYSMEGTPVITANLAIKTPFDVMRNLDIDFMHEMTLSGFHTNVIVNPNDLGKWQLDTSLGMIPKYIFKFELSTPFEYLETLSLTAQSEGTLSSFKTRVEFNHNILGTAVFEGNLELWKGNLLFQSSCPYLKDLQLSFDHSITNGQLRSETEVKINDNTFKVTANGQIEPIDVTLKIELPTTSAEVHASFDGSVSNFRSGLELSKDNRQLVKTGLRLDLTSGITVELQLESPFTRSLDLTYIHTGSLRQFTCNGIVKVDGIQRFSGDLSVNARPTEVEVNVQTSLRKLRSLRVLVNFDGEISNFKSVVDVTYNGNNYKTDVTFSLTPTQGNLQLETTFPLVQSLNMNFDHTGDMSNFQSSAQLSYNNKGNYKAEVEFKANPMAGSVTLTTPLKGAKTINIAFTHNGESDQMQDHVEVTVGGKKYAVDSTLNRKPFELEATITTPIRQYEEIGVKFNQKGNMKNVYIAHGEVTYRPGKKIELDISYKFYSRLNVNVDLKTPLKNMALAVKHQFQGDDINCQAEMTYGSTKAFTGTLTMNIGSSPNGKLKVTTALPGFEEMSVEFSHQMSGQTVSSSADMNLFGTRMSGKLEYANGNGNIDITTPLRGYEEITVKIQNQMTNGLLTSAIKGSINGRQISASVTAKYQGLTDMEATVEIRTPFARLDYIKVHAKQEGGLDNMKTEIAIVLPQEYSIEGMLSLQTASGVTANLKTNIRGLEDVAITFDHVSNNRVINTVAQIQYAANKVIAFKIDMSKGVQSMDGTISFTSPFRRFESLAAEMHHRQGVNDLESKILLSWADGQQIAGNVMYQSDNGIPVSGSVTLNAPFMSEKSVEFRNTIQGNSIESAGKMTWSPSKALQLNLRASYSGDRSNLDARASLAITTPFSLLKEFNVAAAHQHSSVMVDNSVTIDYNSKRIVDSKVLLNRRTGTVTITGPVKVLANYNNDRNGGSFNMQHPFEVDASYTNGDQGMSMTMQKPYRMDATYEADRNGGKVRIIGPIKVDGQYTLSRQGASLNLRKPFEIDVAATYTGNGGSLQMQNPIQIDTRIDLSRESGSFVMTQPFQADASYTYNRNGGSFNMQNPLTVDASYSLSRNGGSVSVKEPIAIEASCEYTGNSVSLSVDKPYQLHGGFELTPTGASVEITKPYAVDAAYSLDQTGGSVSMRNPIRVDAGYTVNAEGHSLNINSPIKVNAEYKWFGNGGSFVMVNPVAIDVEGTMTMTDGHLKMINPYPIDTAYNFEWNRASLKMVKPYPIDVAYDVTPKKGSFVMQQPYPVDVSYLWTTKNGFLKMDLPLQMEASYRLTKPSLNDLEGSIMVNWNKASSSSNVMVDLMHKDESSRYSLVKQGSIRAALPTRTIGLAMEVELSTTKFKQSSEVTWDEARDRKVSYLIDINRPSESAIDATATLVTPIRSMETSVKQSTSANGMTTEATVSWDASRDRSKSLTVKNVLQKTNTYTRSSETTISCPAFNRDIVVRNEMTMGDGHVYFSCKHELEYSNNPSDKLTISTRVADDGNHYYGNHNYTMEVAVSHPSSTMDISLVGHAGVTDVAASTGVNVQYMTVDRTMANTAMRAEIHKLKDSIKMELDTPFKKAQVTGVRSVSSGVYTYALDAEDETNKVDATLKLNTREYSFDVVAHLNPSNPTELVSIKGNYLSATSMQLVATHGTPANEIKDTEVLINLEEDHLLKTNVFWRPAMVSDMKAAIMSSMSSVDLRPITRSMKQARQFLSNEIHAKAQIIRANLPDLTQTRNYLRTEYMSFKTDYKVMQRELNRMYWKNEFYMKSIDRAIDATIAVMIDVAQKVYTVTKTVVIKASELCSAACLVVKEYILENFSEYIEQARELYNKYQPIIMAKTMEVAEVAMNIALRGSMWIMNTAQEVIDTTLDIVDEVITLAEPYVTQLYHWCGQICEMIQQTVAGVKAKYNALVQSYPVRQMATLYQTVASSASSVNWLGPVYDAHLSLSSKVQDVTNKMAQHADWLGEQYTSTIYGIHEAVNTRVEEYIQRPTSQFIKNLAMEVIDQVTWAYNYLGVADRFKAMLQNVCDSSINFVKRNAVYILDEYLHLDLDRVISYNPLNGDLAFQLWIPKEWPSLQTVPFTAGIQWDELWDKVKDIRENINVVPSEFNPWDYYYQYKPASMNPVDWVPPYQAIATINGQHVMTFDGKAYEFMGTCSYILATDVLNSQFTIVGNYPERSLNVFVDGNEYDLSIDGKVTVNGAKTELPMEIKSVAISRAGDVVTLNSARGFTITMDTNTQLFTFELSGWFFNKVAGLLGTYTNEDYDDFLIGNGQRTTDVDAFTGYWKLNNNCRYHANTAQVANIVDTRPSGRICKALFESKISPFRNCFKVVNPLPFLKQCVNDVEMTSDDDAGICRAASTYVFKCDKAGVPLKVPRPCKRCKETVQNTNPQSADVVFVMEQKQCNTDVSSKLPQLAQLVDKALQAKGLTGNRFGLVGYGGRGVHDLPHTHTVGGEVMGTARAMTTAAESLVFIEDGENTDTIGALKMAAEYPFRAGVAKAVVVMACGPCTEQDVNLEEVTAELKNQKIQVHLLVEHEFTMAEKDATPKTNYLFGIDSDTAYTKTDVSKKDLNGDSNLFQQIAPPSDRCASVALNTQGSFFNMQKLKDGRVRYQKNFMDVFARRIAKTAQSDDCSRCECDENGKTICLPCDNTILLGRPGEEPEQFYNDLNEYLEGGLIDV